MKFCLQLSAYFANKNCAGDRVFEDLLEQARLADRLGYESVALTEHHLINLQMMPAPLQFAVKLACETTQVKIITAVSVLPLHDMRIFAGELACAAIFTDHRLMLGVGRGAYTYELERLGVSMESSRERFDESLELLQKLLTEEQVSWKGKYYQFEPLTTMPRPVKQTPMMIAALIPEAIYHSVKRGFHIQTTPLSGDHQHMLKQVNAFKHGKQELGEEGSDLSLSLSRVTFLTRNQPDHQRKIDLAHDYFSRFENVYTGPGIVEDGMVKPLPRKMSIEQTAVNLTIGSPREMIDILAPYAEAGVDRFMMNMNFGAEQNDVLDSIQRFAEEVMPHF
jgi:alkanesulfonate monooxygenase SsuD/methylene tetrahydromethanopterin reductase-like flavin-dependent oxidoreductase (luciferase family)